MPKKHENTRTLQLNGFLPYRLSVTSNLVSDLIASTYHALFGLSIPEWRLVTILAEQSSISQFGLCAAAHMDKVTISRAAIRLVERGLVCRSPNPGDKRSHLLTLTPAGRVLYDQVVPKALMMEDALISGFSQSEVAQLMDLLWRLHGAAERLIDPGASTPGMVSS